LPDLYPLSTRPVLIGVYLHVCTRAPLCTLPLRDTFYLVSLHIACIPVTHRHFSSRSHLVAYFILHSFCICCCSFSLPAFVTAFSILVGSLRTLLLCVFCVFWVPFSFAQWIIFARLRSLFAIRSTFFSRTRFILHSTGSTCALSSLLLGARAHHHFVFGATCLVVVRFTHGPLPFVARSQVTFSFCILDQVTPHALPACAVRVFYVQSFLRLHCVTFLRLRCVYWITILLRLLAHPFVLKIRYVLDLVRFCGSRTFGFARCAFTYTCARLSLNSTRCTVAFARFGISSHAPLRFTAAHGSLHRAFCCGVALPLSRFLSVLDFPRRLRLAFCDHWISHTLACLFDFSRFRHTHTPHSTDSFSGLCAHSRSGAFVTRLH